MDLGLFRIRMFLAGNLSLFLNANLLIPLQSPFKKAECDFAQRSIGRELRVGRAIRSKKRAARAGPPVF